MEPITLLAGGDRPRRILAVGAHCDDIEIGCGGTLLRLLGERPGLEVLWLVLCSTPQRAEEARASAADFLRGAARHRVVVRDFRDGFLPYLGPGVKEAFEEVKREFSPDLVFTHAREDRHQDHRTVSDLTWNTWRNHMVLEYEIPKYDGDFGSPNFFCPLSPSTLDRKIDLVLGHYRSQAGKHWFTKDLLQAVARLRGMEAAAAEGLAEAFTCRKAVF